MMQFSSDHRLFFQERRSVLRAKISLVLTFVVLILNSNSNLYISLIGASIGFILLLIEYFNGQKRLDSTLSWVLLFMLLSLVGAAILKVDMQVLVNISCRMLCGVFWVLWLGTQVDWSVLRQIMVEIKVPNFVVSSMDQALMHGVITRREWMKRLDSSRVRQGSAAVSLSSWGQIIGEGAYHAFSRSEIVHQTSLLRSASSDDTSASSNIRLDDVSVKLGEKLVLEHININISSGEWLLLCGPSGAGKSTLLRLLSGLERPVQGSLNRFDQAILTETPLSQRLDGRVALLMQNPEHHFLASTVAEDIMWGLLKRDVDAKKATLQCFEIAQMLRIEHLLERPCYELSFGEQRRVALAGLMVLKPSLLLLDEPTAGLDPVAAHELIELVNKTVKASKTICVWSTHDVYSAPPHAKRVVLLNDGKIIFDGDTSVGLSKSWLIRSKLMVDVGMSTTVNQT